MEGTLFQDDDKLISAIIGKNIEAFSCLFDKYAPALYGIIMHATNDDVDYAEKILHDYFIWLWHHFQPQEGKRFFTCLLISLKQFMKGYIVLEKNNTAAKIKQAIAVKEDDVALSRLISLVFKGYTKEEIAAELEVPTVEINTQLRNAFCFK